MKCRDGCGACCSAPYITSAIPGIPDGKPAGVRCAQLDDAERCHIFAHPQRPAICRSLMPSAEMCGANRAQAMQWLAQLEAQTTPR